MSSSRVLLVHVFAMLATGRAFFAGPKPKPAAEVELQREMWGLDIATNPMARAYAEEYWARMVRAYETEKTPEEWEAVDWKPESTRTPEEWEAADPPSDDYTTTALRKTLRKEYLLARTQLDLAQCNIFLKASSEQDAPHYASVSADWMSAASALPGQVTFEEWDGATDNAVNGYGPKRVAALWQEFFTPCADHYQYRDEL